MPERDAFDRGEGRVAFDNVAAVYAEARPGYPEQVYELLGSRCGLAAGSQVLEIGAGSGVATRRLLDLGAVVVAVEPSAPLAERLRASASSSRLEVIVEPFEETTLPPRSFDVVVCATAFHWLDPSRSLPAMREALRVGGWLALWWNVFGDPTVPDAFHEATFPLLGDLEPSPAGGRRPFALDADARLRELAVHGFVDAATHVARWDLVVDASQVRRLYSTFSNIARLPPPERDHLLDGVERIARDQFANRVVRKMVTPIYLARRD